MVKVLCDMCGREIDYEVDGMNLDFNHYGVVNFKTPFSAEKQLCFHVRPESATLWRTARRCRRCSNEN